LTGPAIEFRNVSKSFRTIPALSGVSFEVAHGEVCAFLGPNGAGKTTSMNVLMGFLYADSGEVLVLGHLPGDVRAKRQIGFLPENFAFYKHLNAPELLRFHVQLAGLGVQGDVLIPELLRKVKLCGYEELKIGKYSRGMVQRLGIAQALLSDPQLLVLDEPTSGLDPAGRKEVRELILSLKAAGKTIFLSSHLLAEVEQTCDRVIIIDRGRVVRAGRLDELLGRDDRVEIVVDHLPAAVEQLLADRGVSVARDLQIVRLTVDTALKREVAEILWGAGCDVISLNRVRNTLEDLFLKLVGDGSQP
jgi:ABC-2 type transport system ATP-binding protein